MMSSKTIRPLTTCLCAAVLVLGLVSIAGALPIITPATTPQWTGNETSQNQIDAIIGPIMGGAPELYKQNVGEATDSGPFAGSYSTAFNGDLSGGTITWDGGSFINGSPIFLLVKDGNQTPAWYLFELTWNGKDDITMSGFWPANGSISHVAIYGDSTGIIVPEPFSLLLLGLGLVGVGIAVRKRS